VTFAVSGLQPAGRYNKTWSAPPAAQPSAAEGTTAMRVATGFTIGLLLVSGVAGCSRANGGSGVARASRPPGASASARPTATGGDQEQLLRFARCMREHGVQMDDPKAGEGIKLPDVVDPQTAQKVQTAMEACRQYLPNGGQPQKLDPGQLDQLRKFSQCMRDHGIKNFPDPDPNEGLKVDISKLGIDTKDPKFVAAQQACAKYQPAGPSGAPSPVTQTGGAG
jgi:hypothetical protein